MMTNEEAIKTLHELWRETNDSWYEEAFRIAVEALKTDRPHGEWIDRDYRQVDEDGYETAICSNCKTEITLEYPYDNYCPNCGALMGGDTE